MPPVLRLVLVAAAFCLPLGAEAQIDNSRDVWNQITVFDLPLGAKAAALPTEGLMDFACGTNGGPPSTPIGGWTEFATCRPEQSGLREVYFRYDDEAEYWARAYNQPNKIALFEGTTIYEHPIIASALFEAGGRMVGLRIVSDPRASIEMRRKAVTLRNFLTARYGEDGWTCIDVPPAAGESPLVGILIKLDCTKLDQPNGLRLSLQARHLRKPGQSAVDPRTQEVTAGEFESTVRFEALVTDDRQPATAAPARPVDAAPRGEREAAFIAGTSLDCEQCDLVGAMLKRRDLRQARLAGARLAGANLHDARLAGADLSGADLSGANLNKAEMTRARLTGAKLEEALLYAARLEGADLAGADLKGARLGEARLTRATLTDALITGADLSGASLAEANLRGADLSQTWMIRTTITRADLTGASMFRSSLVEAVLRGSRFENVNLQRSDLQQADLTDATFDGADLSGASLLRATIIRTAFSDALMIGTTMPDGRVHP